MSVASAYLLPASEAPMSVPRPRWVMLALWGLLIATAVPAVHLSQQPGGLLPATLFILGAQLPWMLATPVVWAGCRRWPLPGRRPLFGWLLAGLLLTPLLTALGWGMGHLLLHAWQPQPLPSHAQVVRAIGITALFALPTFIAVAGVGHGLAWLQRLRAQAEALQQAREVALRQHLQHHFLFNALNAIGGLALCRPHDADAALVQLASLLRDTVSCPPQRALVAELAAAQDYIALQSLLRDEALQLQLQASAEALARVLPALLLQPLLENAVLHSGWRAGDPPLVIELWAEIESGALQLQVSNPCLRVSQSHGLGSGLATVRRRLQDVGGSLCTRGEGTRYRVRLTVPAQP